MKNTDRYHASGRPMRSPVVCEHGEVARIYQTSGPQFDPLEPRLLLSGMESGLISECLPEPGRNDLLDDIASASVDGVVAISESSTNGSLPTVSCIDDVSVIATWQVQAVNLALSIREGSVVALGTDGATFVSETIPDDTPIPAGQAFTKTWTLRNSGTTTWTTGVSGYTLNFVTGDQMGAPAYVTLTSAVAPNGQTTFSVPMTAPTAPGTYTGYWRMNSASGTSFGPTLSVKIVATLLPGPTITSPGTASDTGYTVSNLTPTFAWNAVSGASRYGLYISREPYGSANIIYSNENLTGTSFLLPPGVLENGVKYRWNMVTFNGAGAAGSVGNTLYFQTQALTDGATFVSETIPDDTPIPAGQAFTKTWTLRNSGTTTWTTGVSGYTLNFVTGDQMGAPAYVTLTSAVAPNGQTTFSVPMTAPTAPGTYTGYWRMNSASSAPFGDTVTVQIVVPQTRLPAPTLNTPIDGTTGVSTGTSFSWSQVTGNHGYRIIVSANPADMTTDPTSTGVSPADGFNADLTTYDQNSYSPTSALSAGTTYYWEVHAKAGTTDQAGYWSQGSFTTAAYLAAPTLLSPGSSSAPGTTLSTYTPQFQWQEVAGADGYALFISQLQSDGTTYSLVFNSSTIGGPLTGTSYSLPAGYITSDGQYRWNMATHSAAGYGSPNASRYYFTESTPQTADYSGATWIGGVPSSNYSAASRTASDIRWVIIHTTESSADSAIQWFQNPASGVSANYLVKRDGTIVQLVKDHDIAYQAGNLSYNENSIGIEHERSGSETPTEAQYAASAALVQWLANQYNVQIAFPIGIGPADPSTGTGIIGHFQVPDPTNPSLGGGLYHHTDPVNWDWAHYIGLFNETPVLSLPSTIRVLRTATGAIDTVDFETYVENVLPREWGPVSSFEDEALRAGAIAVKTYAWYWTIHQKYPGLGYDVKDSTADQVYVPGSSTVRTNQAVSYTWFTAMSQAGSIFQAQYDSGTRGSPDPLYPGRLSQWGTEYWAEQGKDYRWILSNYYPGIEFTAAEAAALNVSTTTLTLPATTQGTAGATTSFTVSGGNLTASASVVLTAPTGSEISLNGSSGFATILLLSADGGGALASTQVYARIRASATANVSGILSVVDSLDNCGKLITVGGTVQPVSQANSLSVPYVQQCYDTANDFDGRWACAPTSAVMVLAYYKQISAKPITCTGYGNTPTHTSNYGFYVSNPFLSSDGSTYFSTSSLDPKGNAAEGAFGYIWKDGENGVEQNLVGFLGKNGLNAQFVADPSQAAAQALVQSQIDAGNPLVARTYLTTAGHYVVIVGYEWVGSTFEYLVNDPFGQYGYTRGYDPRYGESEYEVTQPQAYTYAQMDLGDAKASRGLITVSGPSTVAGNVALTADSTWTVSTGDTLVLNGTLGGNGHTLTVDGGGTLVLAGGQDGTTGLSLNISGSTVRLGGSHQVLVLDSLDLGDLFGALGLSSGTSKVAVTSSPIIAAPAANPSPAFAAIVPAPVDVLPAANPAAQSLSVADLVATSPESLAAQAEEKPAAVVTIPIVPGAGTRPPSAPAATTVTPVDLLPAAAPVLAQAQAFFAAGLVVGSAESLVAQVEEEAAAVPLDEAVLAADAHVPIDRRPEETTPDVLAAILAPSARIVSEIETATLNRIASQGDTVRQADGQLAWEAPSPYVAHGELSDGLGDGLVDILELADLLVPLGA